MHIKPSSRFSLYHFSKLLKFAIYLVYYVFLQLSFLAFLLYFSFKVCINIVMQRLRSRQRRWKWCGEVSSEEVWVSIKSSTNCKSHLFCQFSTAEKFGANSQSFPPWKLWKQIFLLHGAKLFCHPAASSLRCCQFTHMDTHLYFYCLDFHRHRLCLPHHLPLLQGYTAQCLSFFKNSTQCILTEQMYAYCLEQGLSHSWNQLEVQLQVEAVELKLLFCLMTCSQHSSITAS